MSQGMFYKELCNAIFRTMSEFKSNKFIEISNAFKQYLNTNYSIWLNTNIFRVAGDK